MYSIQEIKTELKKGSLQRIVFPEGDELTIQKVAETLVAEKLAVPILIFERQKDVPQKLNPGIQVVINEKLDLQPFIDQFLAIRKEKANLELAMKVMKIRAYIGAMMVKMNQADAMVCGLTFTTADTLRPALQIIKTAPDFSLASSILIMKRKTENYLMGDCALNITPTAAQLADITKMSIQFAQNMNIKDPEAVLLSYSTYGSGMGEQVERVQQAIKILDQAKVDFNFDGELQFDAAVNESVRLKKAPHSKLKKPTPDIFIFPDLQSGNIGYKIAQRWGGFEAIGPFILGLNQPVNDLSRGASFEDVLDTALITAFQALKGKK